MVWNPKDLEEQLLIGSTLVEGSTLTEKEAKEVLAGKTIQGHPVHEIRELVNYRNAVEWLIQELRASPYLSKDLLLEFHARLFQGFAIDSGTWKTNKNYTYHVDGTRHDYLHPSMVDNAISDWMNAFNAKTPRGDILEKAAHLYLEFQNIHPFEDGNGRIGRILIAYWLHWKASLNFVFKLKDKLEHLEALEQGNRGNLKSLVLFFKKRTKGKR